MVTQVAKISELVGEVPNNRLFTDDSGNLLVSVSGSQALTDAQLRASALQLPDGAATEATLDDLRVAAIAIKAAAESLDAKTVTIDTSAVAGKMGLDADTLAALESINVTTDLDQPLTDTELRATPVTTQEADYPITAMGYDARGNLVSMTRAGPGGEAQTKTLTRDEQGRVTAISAWS